MDDTPPTRHGDRRGDEAASPRGPIHDALASPSNETAENEHLVFAPNATEAARARRFVTGLLDGRCDLVVVDDVALLTSELVTNVIRHARTSGELILIIDDDVVRLEVDDHEPIAALALGRPDPTADSGRGLSVVDAIAEAWGVECRSTGKRVWAEVRRNRP